MFCPWPEVGDRRHKNPRAVTSCDACREKKVRKTRRWALLLIQIRCSSKHGERCDACFFAKAECTWTTRESRVRREVHPPQMGMTVAALTALEEAETPQGDELRSLLRLYFTTVHRQFEGHGRD